MVRFALVITFLALPFLGFNQERDSLDNQQKEPFNLADKLYWGGGFWAQFGNSTFVNISPRVGYRFTDKFSAGIGAKYQYMSFRDLNSNYKESASLYGGTVFSRYSLTEQLFLMGEYEHINIKDFWITNNSNWTDFLLVGAGYQYNVGGLTSLNAQIMYDVLENPLLPYFYQTIGSGLPIILRFGVSFGI